MLRKRKKEKDRGKDKRIVDEATGQEEEEEEKGASDNRKD